MYSKNVGNYTVSSVNFLKPYGVNNLFGGLNMTKKFRLSMIGLGLLVLLMAGCGGAGKANGVEEDFPTKPIELIVPFAAGGPTDMTARILATSANKYLPNNKEVVVVNKVGASGTIGTTEVVNAKPDGYTLVQVTGTSLGVQPLLGRADYTRDDLKPIIQIASLPSVLVVNADAPWDTFEEWEAWVKENPGEFTYGTPGVGSFGNINFEDLSGKMGVETQHIPFEGNSEAVTSLLGGHIKGAVLQDIDAKSHVESGDMKALAVIGSYAPDWLDGIPLVKEKGYDVTTDLFIGVMAPKDLPDEIQSILHDAFKKTLEDPEVIESFKTLNTEPYLADPEQFKTNMEDASKVLEEILKEE